MSRIELRFGTSHQFFWNYATHIVRVCVSSKSPINIDYPFTKKSNLQVHYGSKAMASLYDLLCYHPLTSTDPLLEELLCYFPTLFHSHIFDYIAYGHSSGDESVRSIDSSISAFYSDDSTNFSQIFLDRFYFFHANPNYYHKDGQTTVEKSRRPRTTDDPKEGRKTLQYPELAGNGKHLQLLPLFLGSPGGEQSHPLPTVEACRLNIPRQIRTELLY